MASLSPAAPAHFRADLDRFAAALAPHVMRFPDGFVGVDPTAVPAPLLDAYGGLLTLGWANGWLVPED